MSHLRIESRNNQTSLEFRACDDAFFTVEFAGPDLRATARVSSYQSLGLPEFFAEMARDWKGWSGSKEWRSFEGEFGMSATSDQKGHIFLEIELADNVAPPPWQLKATLTIEAGQLDRLAKSARAFEASSMRVV